MEFDELYATHGNSACKAAETFQLRNRISYQGMVSGFRIFTGPLRRGAKWDPHLLLSAVDPSLAEPFRNLTLVFYLLVIHVQIAFSLTISSRRHMLAASPESGAILRRRFGILTQIAT
jgi:hypothetical protein